MSNSTWQPFPRTWTPSGKVNENTDFVALSYNILHDSTIHISPSNNPQLIGHPELVSSTFRNERILLEIEAWSPDVVTLQEMDVEYFGSQWLPKMASLGYVGHLATPGGSVTFTSVAVFYKHTVFQLKQVECCLTETLINEKLPDLKKEVQLVWDPRITHRAVNFVHLQHRASKREVLMVCLHLMWAEFKQPLFQSFETMAVLRKASEMAKNLPCVLMGDFNLRPQDPSYELMSSGMISENTESLMSSEISRDEALLRAAICEKLQHDLRLSSCNAEVLGKEPEVTCYSMENGITSSDTLDYIWYTPGRGMRLSSVMEMPPSQVVKKYEGIPSPIFPSDHLPVGARFTFEC